MIPIEKVQDIIAKHAKLEKELSSGKIDTKLLPYAWNMQDLTRVELLNENLPFLDLGWIYHFNGIPNNKNGEACYYWMNKTYDKISNI